MLRERIGVALSRRPSADPSRCPHCRGRGWIRLWAPMDCDMPTDRGLCWDCRGTGKSGYDDIAAAILTRGKRQ